MHPSSSNESNNWPYVCCLLGWQYTAKIIQTARKSRIVFMCTTKLVSSKYAAIYLTDVFQFGSTTNSAPSLHSVLSLRVRPRSTNVTDVSKPGSKMYFILSVQFISSHFCYRHYTYISSRTDVSQSGSTIFFILSSVNISSFLLQRVYLHILKDWCFPVW